MRGLAASNVHVTGTGRLAWDVRILPDGEQLVEIAVRRPAEIVGGIGSLTVLRVIVRCNHVGEAYEVMEVQTSGLAEKRHWECLFETLQMIGVGNHTATGDLFDQCMVAICGHTDWTVALDALEVRDIHFWMPRDLDADAVAYQPVLRMGWKRQDSR